MRHPIQKLYYCARTKLLFTGIKGTIQVFDTASGILLRQWEAPELPTIVGKKQKQQQHQKQQQQKEKKPQSTSTDEQSENNGSGTVEIEVATGDEEGVTVKKRKVDDITSSPMVAPATISVAEGKITPEPSQKKKKISFREAPGMGGWSSQKGSNMVTNMVGTSSGRHLVVATNEDKTLRVFRVSELVKGRDVWAEAGGMEGDIEGDLQLLSERQMPKRLCALQLLEKKESMTDEEETSPDGVTIICGDKFGDVYSLPLIHNPEDTKPPTPARGTQNDSSTTPEPERKAPRDTGIITTARNKRAAQKAGEMSSRNSIANLEAKELQFKHKLLLGHVSLLLDVLPVTLQVELPDGEKKLRTWILSADKDEHIRVSRHPHSYVIEGFCLGHNSYVSKLLVPSFDKQTLISGGGDDYLLRWDWKAQRLEQKLDLKEHVAKVLEIVKHNREKIKESSIRGGAMDVDAAEAEEEFQISVTGLWEFRDDVHKRNQVLVSVEGLPALFVFTQRVTGTFEYTTTAGVTGNILDVAVVGNRILVSIDPQSAPFRLPVLGEERDLLVDYLEPEEDKKHFDVITRADAEKVVTTINSKASWEITAEQKAKLNEFLYSAKHLRKFEGEEKGGD